MSNATPHAPILSNRAYDVLKFVTQILLPGIGALYFALAGIWGLPNSEEVVGTITAVVVFLGLFLGVSTKAYNQSDSRFDGAFELRDDAEGNKIVSLNLEDNPEALEKKDAIVFKVNRHT